MSAAPEVFLHSQEEFARRRPWFVLPGSPGGLGDPEVWLDEAALDRILHDMNSGPAYVGATVHVGHEWTARDDQRGAAYVVTLRRTGPGTVNLGRPYYVLQWPD